MRLKRSTGHELVRISVISIVDPLAFGMFTVCIFALQGIMMAYSMPMKPNGARFRHRCDDYRTTEFGLFKRPFRKSTLKSRSEQGPP